MAYDVKDFQAEVIERSRTIPVLVDFWAAWCGPCRILTPVLEGLAERNRESWALAKLNTEEFPQIAAKYGIRSIPNVKLFVDGKPVNEFVGALPEPAIVEWLRKAIPPKKIPAVEEAKALLAQMRLAEAQRLLEPVAAAGGSSEEARALLARTLLFTEPERAARLVSDIEAGEAAPLADAVRTLTAVTTQAAGDHLPEGSVRQPFRDAAAAVAAQDFEGGLQKFIATIREDRYYHDDAARKAVIAIFRLLGDEHPLVAKYRREFSSALY